MSHRTKHADKRIWLLTLALAAAAIYLFSTHAGKPPQASYVNPALCTPCHQQIAKTYSQTGMGRSFSIPRPENIVEDYQTHNTLYHHASDRYYTMTAHDGHWFQRRHQLGFDGAQTNIVETQIDYVIGSGNHARSYLHRTNEGKLAELPITWYAEKSGYWAMSPGYDRPGHSDFRRAISYECMACHNGYPSSIASVEPAFTGAIPQGIDCQRCHGPGSAHIEVAGSGSATPDAIRRAIVNPARLSRDRQLDICWQCHLQTTSLHSPDSIRRYNRPPFSFKPGEALNDYRVHFDFPDSDKFEIDHAAYRLAKSKCFEQSQMTCTTCHNPHQAEQSAEHYQKICRDCHSAAHAMDANKTACLDCHMPKRRTDDVVHAVMTDHYIQRVVSAKDLQAPREEIHQPAKAEITIYKSSSNTDLYLAVAEAQNQNPTKLEAAIERLHPAEPEFYFELGRAYVKSGAYDKGIHWLQEALRIRPDYTSALKELGAAFSDSGQLSRAAETLQTVNDADALTDLGGVYIKEGNPNQAEQALLKALAIDPDLPAAHNLLGLARARNGESEFREAIRIQPDFAEAYTNLGNLLAGNGDLKQAIFHFKKAIASDPDNIDAHYNLGQALAASGSLREALTQFQTVARLNPNAANIHCDLGRLLTFLGQPEAAKQHLHACSK